MASQSPTRALTSDAHPYPVKTTSTGILTRSNSSSAHGSWARHQYSPASRSPIPNVRADGEASPTRSDTARNVPVSPSPSKYSRSWVGRTFTGERVKLPRHPYSWTPNHLGEYLTATLTGSDGEPLEPEIVKLIVDFVHEKKLGGRAFLSLDQEDFQEMDGVDPAWAHALWDASCTLRATTMPHRTSRISSAAYKRGRVRGIVGAFERSASESSDVGDDEPPRRPRVRGATPGNGSAGTDATPEDKQVPLRSGAPTPRPSYPPESSGANPDLTLHPREVEITSVTNDVSEPTMAELYEQTYGVPAPSRMERHEAVSDGDGNVDPERTVTNPDVSDGPIQGQKVVQASTTPVPSNLGDIFVRNSPPATDPRVPERHILVSSPHIVGPPMSQDVYVLPPDGDKTALSTLEVLKARLQLVERRLAAIENKNKINGHVVNDIKDNSNDDASARWSESRQSAYILFAGATAGVSLVLIPMLFRHLWTR